MQGHDEDRIVAYLMGEMDPADAVAFERDLAADSDLNDEAARWREALGAASAGASASSGGQAPAPENPGEDQGERGDLRFSELKDMVAASLARRPQTAAQLALALGVPQRMVDAALAELAGEDRIAGLDSQGAESRGFFGPVSH